MGINELYFTHKSAGYAYSEWLEQAVDELMEWDRSIEDDEEETYWEEEA